MSWFLPEPRDLLLVPSIWYTYTPVTQQWIRERILFFLVLRFLQCQPPFAIRYFVFWFPQCQPEVVNNTILHSLFHVLISSMPARISSMPAGGGQQHHSPFAILCFDLLPASQRWSTSQFAIGWDNSPFTISWCTPTANILRDPQHHSPFTIRFLENGWEKCIQFKG